jgi:hypothetical protein
MRISPVTAAHLHKLLPKITDAEVYVNRRCSLGAPMLLHRFRSVSAQVVRCFFADARHCSVDAPTQQLLRRSCLDAYVQVLSRCSGMPRRWCSGAPTILGRDFNCAAQVPRRCCIGNHTLLRNCHDAEEQVP